jgi:hypothetical protein
MSSSVRFSQAQRRDLLRMSGAAVVSTIFFGVPMVLGRPDAARLQSPPGQIQPAQVEPAQEQTATASPVAVPQDAQVAVVFSEEVAQVTVPVLAGLPTAAGHPARPTRTARRTVAAPFQPQRAQVTPATGKPLSRLGRLFTGSGRYEVRPFPTVGTSGS